MKKITKIFMLFVAISIFFWSCSIEKRHYSKGFYIQWKHNNNGDGVASTDVANKKAVDSKKGVVYTEAMATETPSVIANDNVLVIEEREATSKVENVVSLNEVKTSEIKRNTSNEVSSNLKEIKTHKTNRKSNRIQNLLIKKALKSASKSAAGGGPSKGLLIVLCFLIPWLAVGLATDWDVMPIIYNLLWSLTCIGGIIHAIIVVNREA